MSCKNCSPLCFEPVTDQCVTYTGPSNSAMGIEQNESLSSALTKLINFTQKLYDKLNECNPCAQMNSGVSFSSTLTGNEQSITTLPLNITSTPGDTSTNITYSIPSLPDGHELLYSTVSIDGTKNGYPARLSESSNLAGGFTVQPNNFPIVLNLDMKTISTDGEHVFKFSSEVSPVNTDYSLDVISSKNTTTPIVDQNDVNTHLNKKINDLAQKFDVANSITSSTIPGNSTPETIVYLMNTIQDLKNKVG